jgi:hypothetical protein
MCYFTGEKVVDALVESNTVRILVDNVKHVAYPSELGNFGLQILSRRCVVGIEEILIKIKDPRRKGLRILNTKLFFLSLPLRLLTLLLFAFVLTSGESPWGWWTTLGSFRARITQ